MLDPVAAANVVAVVLAAVLWPLSVMLLVRTVVGPSRFALAFSMGAVCVISVFPGQLVSYGVLWPNALSYSILPGVLALGVLLLRHTRFRWVGSVPAGLALVVTAPALYYAHPGAAFAFVAVGLPLLAAAELGLLVVSWGHPRRRMRAIAVGVGTIVVLWVFWNGLYHLPSLNKVRDFNWSPRQSASQAVGEALFLTSSLSSEVGVIGVLVVVGAVWAFRYRTTRWLAFSHAILITLVVVCTSTAGPHPAHADRVLVQRRLPRVRPAPRHRHPPGGAGCAVDPRLAGGAPSGPGGIQAVVLVTVGGSQPGALGAPPGRRPGGRRGAWRSCPRPTP